MQVQAYIGKIKDRIEEVIPLYKSLYHSNNLGLLDIDNYPCYERNLNLVSHSRKLSIYISNIQKDINLLKSQNAYVVSDDEYEKMRMRKFNINSYRLFSFMKDKLSEDDKTFLNNFLIFIFYENYVNFITYFQNTVEDAKTPIAIDEIINQQKIIDLSDLVHLRVYGNLIQYLKKHKKSDNFISHCLFGNLNYYIYDAYSCYRYYLIYILLFSRNELILKTIYENIQYKTFHIEEDIINILTYCKDINNANLALQNYLDYDNLFELSIFMQLYSKYPEMRFDAKSDLINIKYIFDCGLRFNCDIKEDDLTYFSKISKTSKKSNLQEDSIILAVKNYILQINKALLTGAVYLQYIYCGKSKKSHFLSWLNYFNVYQNKFDIDIYELQKKDSNYFRINFCLIDNPYPAQRYHIVVAEMNQSKNIKIVNKNIYFNNTIETPEKIKLELWPHQRAMIKYMSQLEETPKIKIIAETTNDYYVNAYILNDPIGSGKTLTLLGLIAQKQIPQNYPIPIIIKDDDRTIIKNSPIIIQDKLKILRPNLIIVGRGVVWQWYNEIKNHTNLKAFMITNAESLKRFYRLFKNGYINKYDIVLVRNHKITVDIPIDDYPYNITMANKYILLYVYLMSRNYLWARVIYDDYDVIRLAESLPVIRGLFTVYVSSTMDHSSTSSQLSVMGHYNMIRDIKKDNIILNNCVFNTPEQYIKLSKSIPKYIVREYVIARFDKKYLNMIGAINDIDANKIVEMINSDSINTISKTLGIEVVNTSDILQKILQKTIKELKVAIIYTKNIKILRDMVKTMPTEENNKKIRISAESLKHLKEKGYSIDYFNKHINKCSDELINQMDDVYRNQIAIYEKSKGYIDRMRENLSEEDCAICCRNFADEKLSKIMTTCCKIVICTYCFKKTFYIQKTTTEADLKQVSGSCTNCKSKINFIKDIIYIPDCLNITADGIDESFSELTNIEDTEIKEEPVSEMAISPNMDQADMQKVKKLNMMIDIINGRVNKTAYTEKNTIFETLLNGTEYIEVPKDIPRKIIIFSTFAESIDLIKKSLKENKIKYYVLDGTVYNLQNTINNFRNANEQTIMLINSDHIFAGLCLECATDIIFYHRKTNKKVESQSIGRAQRINRTFSLNIHYLLYDNEEQII